jgi:hypothetical protein
MKKQLCFVLLMVLVQTAIGQDKPKPVKYNAFGMGVLPHEELLAGGNHVSYRKVGFGLSWRVGIKNLQMNQVGYGTIPYDTALAKGYLTGQSKSAYSFGANLNFVIPITKKIPFYIGAGVIRHRVAAEVQPPWNSPGETFYVINTSETVFKPNFTAGIFVPLFDSRVVVNLAYDHLPRGVFLGIAISGPFNYEDIDSY